MIDLLCRYKDGVELRSGGKYRVVEDDDKVQLIVRGVDKDDAGDITCELSNSKGKESAAAKLRVQSKHSDHISQPTTTTDIIEFHVFSTAMFPVSWNWDTGR